MLGFLVLRSTRPVVAVAVLALVVAGCGGETVTADSFVPCVEPTPLLIAGQDTGYDTCSGGILQRRAATACPSLLPASCANEDAGVAADSGEACTQGCTSDNDCIFGFICVCGDPIGVCEQASCKTDADCPNGSSCAEYDPNDLACGTVGFACQSPYDQCLTNADCAGIEADGEPTICQMTDGIRICTHGACPP
jgi:hypothetical protein